jgi:hypothetical protein
LLRDFQGVIYLDAEILDAEISTVDFSLDAGAARRESSARSDPAEGKQCP